LAGWNIQRPRQVLFLWPHDLLDPFSIFSMESKQLPANIMWGILEGFPKLIMAPKFTD